MKRITIKDIAKIANVSRGTVDRVLNGRGNVSSEVQKQILKIASDLGYEKNLLASSLASNKSYTLAIVLPNPQSDPFWGFPVQGIERAMKYAGLYNVNAQYFFFDLTDKFEFVRQLANAINANPDCILVAPTFTIESLEYIDVAARKGIPFITINTEVEHDDILCYIGQHSFGSGYLAGRLFDLSLKEGDEIIVVNLGHNVKNASHYHDKIKGLEQYFKDHPAKNTKVLVHEFENFADEKKLSKFIDGLIDKYTKMKGVFITNSRAYRFINAMNVKDSTRFTIIGFDLLEANIRFLKEGRLSFIINQNSVDQGYHGMMAFINHFVLKETIEAKQYLPLDVVMRENVEYYVNKV